MKAVSRIKKVLKNNEDIFEGFYKKHYILIEKEYGEHTLAGYIFYIQVLDSDGLYCYDGYWDGEEQNNLYPTMEDAVEEALIGSLLLKGDHK